MSLTVVIIPFLSWLISSPLLFHILFYGSHICCCLCLFYEVFYPLSAVIPHVAFHLFIFFGVLSSSLFYDWPRFAVCHLLFQLFLFLYKFQVKLYFSLRFNFYFQFLFLKSISNLAANEFVDFLSAFIHPRHVVHFFNMRACKWLTSRSVVSVSIEEVLNCET